MPRYDVHGVLGHPADIDPQGTWRRKANLIVESAANRTQAINKFCAEFLREGIVLVEANVTEIGRSDGGSGNESATEAVSGPTVAATPEKEVPPWKK
jgi:hypothetical protein